MNHPKLNLWSDSRSEYTPTPDPSPKLGEGRKTSKIGRTQGLRPLRTPNFRLSNPNLLVGRGGE